MTMEVKRSQAVALFTALGVQGASGWASNRLLARLNALAEVDFDESKVAKDKTLKNLLKSIMTELEKGDEANITLNEDVKPAKKGAPAPVEEPEEEAEAEAEDAEDEVPAPNSKKPAAKKAVAANGVKKKGPEKAGEPGKPGVIATIVNMIAKATIKKPVTKEQILAKLVEDFPDRDPESMKKTINVQVPGRIRNEKNLDVQKSEETGAFYVKG